MRRWILVMALLLGCGAEEDPAPSEITEPRLLAVMASPPVLVGQSDGAALDALLVDEHGQKSDAAIRWRVCNPWRFVTDPVRDCPSHDSLVLDVPALLVEDVLRAFPPPREVLASLPGIDGAEVPAYDLCESAAVAQLTVIAEATVGDRVLVTRKTVPVVLGAPPRNNPRIDEVRIDGAPAARFRPGRAYELEIDVVEESLDPVCVDARTVLEPTRIFAYGTAGAFSELFVDLLQDEPTQERPALLEWTAPDGDSATLWLVIIDGEGGVGWRSVVLESQ